MNGVQLRRSLSNEAALQRLLKEKVAAEASVSDRASLALLEHAYKHFTAQSERVCPVCHGAIDPDELRSALAARIAAQDNYRTVLASLSKEVLQLHTWCRDIGALAQRVAEEAGVGGTALDLVTEDRRLIAFALTPAADASAAQAIALSEDPSLLGAAAEAAILEATAKAGAYLRAVPPAFATPALQTAAELFKRLVRDLVQLKLLESELNELASEVTLFDKAIGVLRRARQDVAKETLTAIQGLVTEYYFIIHPRGGDDDETGAPSIQVQRHGKGSAFVRGEFHGKEVKDPQFVYSDGHLDTVGICIFLALRTFRAKQPGDPKVMILDDIIISIDLGHARRLITLLRQAFADHQILMLTHNGLFAYWCKYLMPGLRRLQIKGWSLAGGPLIGDYPTAREDIVDALASGTAKEIAIRLMGLLDEWTAEARYAYAVPVPAKVDERYTLTEIWDPLVKQLKDLGKLMVSDLGGAIPALASLADVTSIRNALGAHDNEFAKEFPRAAMVDVAKAAISLVNSLYCDACGSFVVPSPNKTKPVVMNCSGNHKQYVKSPTPVKS